MKNKNTRICFISSSGGHYEQLKMLKPLAEKYTAIWITEKTHYQDRADYYLLQTGSKDILFPFKMTYNFSSLLLFCQIQTRLRHFNGDNGCVSHGIFGQNFP